MLLLIKTLYVAAVTNRINEPTPESVKTFYSCMEQLSRTTDKNQSYYISKKMKECFYGHDLSVSGIIIPNDFRFFDYDGKNISHNDKTLNVTSYINRLMDYIFQDRIMSVTYRILQSEVSGEQPDYSNGRLSMQTYILDTYVEKTYEIKGVRRMYKDTVRTDYTSGMINEIKNGYGITVINVTNLRNKASIAYRRKKFAEAYMCYEQIIALDQEDADALYRIGLMTYFQYKECNLPKRGRKDKAKSYLERAVRFGQNSGISERANNVLFRLSYNI